MRSLFACLVAGLLLGACHTPVSDLIGETPAEPAASPPAETQPPETQPAEATPSAVPVDLTGLGAGAAPGNAKGPGNFVGRGSARNFYTGRGGRLWFYMNNYYWVSKTAPLEKLWIKADVIEAWQDLRTWPKGNSVPGPEPKVTSEYWMVGPTRRSVRIDNHKDYCLLSDGYTAGAISVKVTLTLGHLKVKDKRGRWVESRNGYILESRNYSGGGGLGVENARFVPLRTEAVTTWAYKVPFSTHPQRLTRSNWRDVKLPSWGLEERRAPPGLARPARPVTPSAGSAAGS
jgi:hypothetical protein